MVTMGVLCFVLQVALAPNVALGNGRINFALVYAACFALSVGGREGVICGFLAGLVFDLTTTGPVGLMSLLLTCMADLVGLEGRNRMVDGMADAMASFGISSLVVTVVYHLVMLLMGQAGSIADVLFLRTLPTFALTFVAFLPFAYFMTRASGGASRGSKGLGKHGGHYDTRGL